MKKAIMLLAMMTMTAMNTMGKDAKTLIKEFQRSEEAEHIHISPTLMKLARIAARKSDTDEAGKQVLKKIKCMDILCLSDCKQNVKNRFAEKFDNLEKDGYQPLLTANSEGEQVKLMMLDKDDTIHELAILTADGEDCVMILIEGKMSQKDIQTLVDEQTKKPRQKS